MLSPIWNVKFRRYDGGPTEYLCKMKSVDRAYKIFAKYIRTNAHYSIWMERCEDALHLRLVYEAT